MDHCLSLLLQQSLIRLHCKPFCCLFCLQLLGLDYLVDDSMHPWLLEVNGTPSLAVEHGDAPVEQLIHSTKVSRSIK
jgi:D-alanine-D-alanine ligase-like ATP-grasp enzyme